jgi:GT2 family glycosyltransferase
MPNVFGSGSLRTLLGSSSAHDWIGVRISKTPPSVAIVIPTCGRPEALKVCLRQIVPYVNQHSECSIVVSDDGEVHETKAQLAAEFNVVQIIQGPRRGPAANRNWGAAHSKGELLIFLDDDCRPNPNLVAKYQCAAGENPKCGVFEGRTTAEGKEESFGDTAPSNETGGKLWSCNFAVRRELFASIGGFDERFPFPAMEDTDFHFRVSSKSAILFVPEARIYHALQRKVGRKVLRHHSLSHLLYLHLHGLKATQQGPVFFVRVVARESIFGGMRYLRGQGAKDPHHLLLVIWTNMQFLLITLFWRFHPYLARRLFPACCAGCAAIHSSLITVDQ